MLYLSYGTDTNKILRLMIILQEHLMSTILAIAEMANTDECVGIGIKFLTTIIWLMCVSVIYFCSSL